MADRDAHPEPAEPGGLRALGRVAAGHAVPVAVQDFRNAAHPDAAYADEVEGPEREGEASHDPILPST